MTLASEDARKPNKSGNQPLDRSFWVKPRNTALRRWSFYVHFYAGLIAGFVFSVVGATGSILVFVPELRVLEVPGHAEVRHLGERLPLETLFQTVRRSRPNDRIESFSSASERDSFELAPTKALNFRSYSRTNERFQTFIDPYSGRIICQYNYNHRLLQKVYDLHEYLLAGLTGKLVNAWFAILLLVVSFAGLVLWWRGRKYWRLGLEYRVRASWKRQIWDIHNLGGFVFFLPLLLLAISGIYYSYESQFAKAASFLTQSPASIPTPRSSAPGTKWRAVDEILRSSDEAAPDCKPTIFYFPKSANSSFYVRVHCPYDPHAVGLTYIYVDPATARTTLIDRFYHEPYAMRLVRLVTPIHYGDVGGPATRILWIAVGLTPGILFLTSLGMWWNRSLSKRWSRRRAKAVIIH